MEYYFLITKEFQYITDWCHRLDTFIFRFECISNHHIIHG